MWSNDYRSNSKERAKENFCHIYVMNWRYVVHIHIPPCPEVASKLRAGLQQVYTPEFEAKVASRCKILST